MQIYTASSSKTLMERNLRFMSGEVNMIKCQPAALVPTRAHTTFYYTCIYPSFLRLFTFL